MNGILRHSRWDALPIALSLAHAALLFAAPSAPLIAIGLWWNSNTVSHNFVHLPFFRSRLFNTIYSFYLTMLLGVPQSLWRQRHLAHHRGWGDIQLTGRIVAEVAMVFGVWSVLMWISPQFFFAVYVPGYLIGLGICFMHGYFEHARGTTSNYGRLYNMSFLNDGYHVEHHLAPGEHWTRLPQRVQTGARTSRWPAVFRWLEVFNLECLERIALRSAPIQRFLLKTHEAAIRALLERLPEIRTVKIVGGGMFPRTALIVEKLLPDAEITIVDKNPSHLEIARRFLSGRVRCLEETFVPHMKDSSDLLIIPLAFAGNRDEIYSDPPARVTLIHDWIWSRHHHTDSVRISFALLKRLNLAYSPPKLG
jgi:hypothetical protein